MMGKSNLARHRLSIGFNTPIYEIVSGGVFGDLQEYLRFWIALKITDGEKT